MSDREFKEGERTPSSQAAALGARAGKGAGGRPMLRVPAVNQPASRVSDSAKIVLLHIVPDDALLPLPPTSEQKGQDNLRRILNASENYVYIGNDRLRLRLVCHPEIEAEVLERDTRRFAEVSVQEISSEQLAALQGYDEFKQERKLYIERDSDTITLHLPGNGVFIQAFQTISSSDDAIDSAQEFSRARLDELQEEKTPDAIYKTNIAFRTLVRHCFEAAMTEDEREWFYRSLFSQMVSELIRTPLSQYLGRLLMPASGTPTAYFYRTEAGVLAYRVNSNYQLLPMDGQVLSSFPAASLKLDVQMVDGETARLEAEFALDDPQVAIEFHERLTATHAQTAEVGAGAGAGAGAGGGGDSSRLVNRFSISPKCAAHLAHGAQAEFMTAALKHARKTPDRVFDEYGQDNVLRSDAPEDKGYTTRVTANKFVKDHESELSTYAYLRRNGLPIYSPAFTAHLQQMTEIRSLNTLLHMIPRSLEVLSLETLHCLQQVEPSLVAEFDFDFFQKLITALFQPMMMHWHQHLKSLNPAIERSDFAHGFCAGITRFMDKIDGGKILEQLGERNFIPDALQAETISPPAFKQALNFMYFVIRVLEWSNSNKSLAEFQLLGCEAAVTEVLTTYVASIRNNSRIYEAVLQEELSQIGEGAGQQHQEAVNAFFDVPGVRPDEAEAAALPEDATHLQHFLNDRPEEKSLFRSPPGPRVLILQCEPFAYAHPAAVVEEDAKGDGADESKVDAVIIAAIEAERESVTAAEGEDPPLANATAFDHWKMQWAQRTQTIFQVISERLDQQLRAAGLSAQHSQDNWVSFRPFAGREGICLTFGLTISHQAGGDQERPSAPNANCQLWLSNEGEIKRIGMRIFSKDIILSSLLKRSTERPESTFAMTRVAITASDIQCERTIERISHNMRHDKQAAEPSRLLNTQDKAYPQPFPSLIVHANTVNPDDQQQDISQLEDIESKLRASQSISELVSIMPDLFETALTTAFELFKRLGFPDELKELNKIKKISLHNIKDYYSGYVVSRIVYASDFFHSHRAAAIFFWQLVGFVVAEGRAIIGPDRDISEEDYEKIQRSCFIDGSPIASLSIRDEHERVRYEVFNFWSFLVKVVGFTFGKNQPYPESLRGYEDIVIKLKHSFYGIEASQYHTIVNASHETYKEGFDYTAPAEIVYDPAVTISTLGARQHLPRYSTKAMSAEVMSHGILAPGGFFLLAENGGLTQLSTNDKSKIDLDDCFNLKEEFAALYQEGGYELRHNNLEKLQEIILTLQYYKQVCKRHNLHYLHKILAIYALLLNIQLYLHDRCRQTGEVFKTLEKYNALDDHGKDQFCMRQSFGIPGSFENIKTAYRLWSVLTDSKDFFKEPDPSNLVNDAILSKRLESARIIYDDASSGKLKKRLAPLVRTGCFRIPKIRNSLDVAVQLQRDIAANMSGRHITTQIGVAEYRSAYDRAYDDAYRGFGDASDFKRQKIIMLRHVAEKVVQYLQDTETNRPSARNILTAYQLLSAIRGHKASDSYNEFEKSRLKGCIELPNELDQLSDGELAKRIEAVIARVNHAPDKSWRGKSRLYEKVQTILETSGNISSSSKQHKNRHCPVPVLDKEYWKESIVTALSNRDLETLNRAHNWCRKFGYTFLQKQALLARMQVEVESYLRNNLGLRFKTLRQYENLSDVAKSALKRNFIGSTENIETAYRIWSAIVGDGNAALAISAEVNDHADEAAIENRIIAAKELIETAKTKSWRGKSQLHARLRKVIQAPTEFEMPIKEIVIKKMLRDGLHGMDIVAGVVQPPKVKAQIHAASLPLIAYKVCKIWGIEEVASKRFCDAIALNATSLPSYDIEDIEYDLLQLAHAHAAMNFGELVSEEERRFKTELFVRGYYAAMQARCRDGDYFDESLSGAPVLLRGTSGSSQGSDTDSDHGRHALPAAGAGAGAGAGSGPGAVFATDLAPQSHQQILQDVLMEVNGSWLHEVERRAGEAATVLDPDAAGALSGRRASSLTGPGSSGTFALSTSGEGGVAESKGISDHHDAGDTVASRGAAPQPVGGRG